MQAAEPPSALISAGLCGRCALYASAPLHCVLEWNAPLATPASRAATASCAEKAHRETRRQSGAVASVVRLHRQQPSSPRAGTSPASHGALHSISALGRDPAKPSASLGRLPSSARAPDRGPSIVVLRLAPPPSTTYPAPISRARRHRIEGSVGGGSVSWAVAARMSETRSPPRSSELTVARLVRMERARNRSCWLPSDPNDQGRLAIKRLRPTLGPGNDVCDQRWMDRGSDVEPYLRALYVRWIRYGSDQRASTQKGWLKSRQRVIDRTQRASSRARE